MPFLIAADFNNPVVDFPAYRAFHSIRCQEAFELASHKFAKDLPPTCRNTTRNDSFIIHEALVPWVSDIWVGPEHVFPDHRPLYVTFTFPGTQRMSHNWYMPCSWGDIPLDPQLLDRFYATSPHRHTSYHTLSTEVEINAACHSWSKGVEDAVRRTIEEQHKLDPLHFPQPVLPRKFYGRCAPTKFVTHTFPKSARFDPTNAYNPPVEATTCKARLKTRQVRRIASLIRQIKAGCKHAHDMQHNTQIQQEWNVIRTAQGYGHSWPTWLLSFEFVPFVPTTVPDLEWLELALQVSRFDADAYARQEQILRRNHRKHSIEFARAHTNNAAAYRFIKNKEQKFLQDVPEIRTSAYTLCRSRKDLPVIRLHQPLILPTGATVSIGDTTATIASQIDDKLRLTNVQGTLPACATVSYKTHAYHIDKMSQIFQQFWTPFWQRDSLAEQDSNDVWEDLFHDLSTTIPHQAPLHIITSDPSVLWTTIKRMKTHKAIGVDGWNMIVDLSNLLKSMWSHGLTGQQMQARTLLFAKCEKLKICRMDALLLSSAT